jgi:hypothetical protein
MNLYATELSADGRALVTCSGEALAQMCTMADADVIVEYLNQDDRGQWSAESCSEGPDQHSWVLVQDEIWVAYTSTSGDAETLLSHLNRH